MAYINKENFQTEYENAIPWAIYPNGDKKMLDVKLIKE